MTITDTTFATNCSVTKETEKALCLSIEVSNGRSQKNWDLWFPKSQVEVYTHAGGTWVAMSDMILKLKDQDLAKYGYSICTSTAGNIKCAYPA